MNNQIDKFLCYILCVLALSVLALAIYDPASRPGALDFAKVALGGILTAISATAATRGK